MDKLFHYRGLDKLFHRRGSELFHWRVELFHWTGLSFSIGGVNFFHGGGLSPFKGVMGRPDQKIVINQYVKVKPLMALAFIKSL